jgi:mono/diheme cytochrome c family protein
LIVIAIAFAAFGCSDDNGDNNEANNTADAGDVMQDTAEEDTEADTEPQQVAWADVSAIFEDRDCAGCHGNTPNSYQTVVDEWIEGPDGDLLGPKMEINHRINDADAAVVLAWIEQGYPEE